MYNKIQIAYKNKKTGRSFSLVSCFSKKDFFVVLIVIELVKLFTNETFLKFVVEIVKLILNRPFYYLCNNRIFAFNEVNHGLEYVN